MISINKMFYISKTYMKLWDSLLKSMESETKIIACFHIDIG